MNVEVRATHLREIRDKRGLTQRQLARDIGVSQNYIPALEAGSRRPGPDIRERLTKYFGCGFEDLFEIVLVDPDTKREQLLRPAAGGLSAQRGHR
jgi:putative transcriptional regulator